MTFEQILAWADAHRVAVGQWPTRDSGRVIGATALTWALIEKALNEGRWGLPGGLSLSWLLRLERGVKKGVNPPPGEQRLAQQQTQVPSKPRRRRATRRPKSQKRLMLNLILSWADVHYQTTGRWPSTKSGPIGNHTNLTWRQVSNFLRFGRRGLPGGQTLEELLRERRGVRDRRHLPPLRIEQILAWADAYHQAKGQWPLPSSGPIAQAPEFDWKRIDRALVRGSRGLPGGSSLAQLLTEHRGFRNRLNPPPVRIEQILAWADAHHQAKGQWPTTQSGPISEHPELNWEMLNNSLRDGLRGLPGGSSLAKLLQEHRGLRDWLNPPPLSIEQILAWADAYYQATGKWPTAESGPIRDHPELNWEKVDASLRRGRRGLPGGQSLSKLLQKHRGLRDRTNPPPLRIEQILAWADAHHQATGQWPTARSGPIRDHPELNWLQVDGSLRLGRRGLPGGQTLAELLQEHRGFRNRRNLPPLRIEQILAWADAHRARTGRWPLTVSGPVAEAPGETWANLNAALYFGNRGLPGGSSLALLIAEHREPFVGAEPTPSTDGAAPPRPRSQQGRRRPPDTKRPSRKPLEGRGSKARGANP